ncbi:uncharacterized protein B0H18DRAFT_29998 [Fomitopsis serialis]|uniref:uncharacterized protein n=1 Tax=Fomitopsis serialis TaxID=139415 RepID=UPI002007C5FF|nr:uncharacterized protein B0H18DRAFT_29998 [Neoantrodia serialis]KAH9932562.1 hypothetical protein B0H18DRAFT_29998 [Neoantrodia serialis]
MFSKPLLMAALAIGSLVMSALAAPKPQSTNLPCCPAQLPCPFHRKCPIPQISPDCQQCSSTSTTTTTTTTPV